MDRLSTRQGLGSSKARHGRPDALTQLFRAGGNPLSAARGAEIYAEEDEAEAVYLVISGTVRICKYRCDGKRQISAFHTKGDIFGFEPTQAHRFSAEAVEDCTLLAVKRGALTAAAGEDAELAGALWALTAEELQRAHEHMLLLGRQSATERMLSFLDSVAERLGDPSRVDLPMGRQDIADHLGLTIETVSRTMTQLAEARAIVVEGIRRIRLASAERLAA